MGSPVCPGFPPQYETPETSQLEGPSESYFSETTSTVKQLYSEPILNGWALISMEDRVTNQHITCQRIPFSKNNIV